MEQYYTVEEASKILHYKLSYLYKLMHENRIAYFKPTGGKALFSQTEIDAFVQRGRVATAEEIDTQANTILEQMEENRRAEFEKPVRAKQKAKAPKVSTRSTQFTLASRSAA